MTARAANFAVSLNGLAYRFQLRWCDPAAYWVLNVTDPAGVPILSGVPLVTGTDLLAQLKYLGIGDGGALVVTKDDGDPSPPTWQNLGTVGHLFFLSPSP